MDGEAVLRTVDLDQLDRGCELVEGLAGAIDRYECVGVAVDDQGGSSDLAEDFVGLQPKHLVEQRATMFERRGELDGTGLVQLPGGFVADDLVRPVRALSIVRFL